MNESSAWAITSTSALPIPTTSISNARHVGAGYWSQSPRIRSIGVSDNPYRLPLDVVPSRYRLVLEPDLGSATFIGTVSIDVTATEAVESVMLNADELDITSVYVNGADVSFHLETATERLVIDSALDAGHAVIDITFTGTLNDKLHGWYRSTFNDEHGVERVIATTQMQATDCRRAFPCFDEPEFKAVFDITLIVEPDLLAVSNGPEIGRVARDDGKHVVVFRPTMPMSTYLVAFVVGPLEATEPIDVDGTPLRVVHVPGKGHLTDFALEIGAFSLRWYQQLLRHPVPQRQGRHAGPARLRRRRDGEPRLHHLSRKPAARRPEDGDTVSSCRTSPMSSPTRSPTCGSATW